MGQFEAKFYVEGLYKLTFRVNVYEPLYGGMVILHDFARESFHTKKVCSTLYSFRLSLCESPFEGLITYALRLHVGKPVVDFLFVIIELFCYLLRLRRYKRKSVEVGVFEKRGTITYRSLCQKTRVIVLSCGIKISAVHCLVLSQSTRVTDRRSELRLPRPR